MHKASNENNISILDALRELLLQGSVSTQEEICNALLAQGYDANQSKVSRSLRKIGAIKGKNEFNQIVYRLPKEPPPPGISTRLAGLVIDIRANESCIIMDTSPGSASLIARMLDYHRDKAGLLGTIAGDDTILIIPKSVIEIDNIIIEIKELLASS